MHYLKDYLELLEPLRELMREKFTLMRENDLKLQVEFTQLEEDSSEFLNNYRLYQKQSSLSPTKSKINMHRLTTPINDQSFELTPEQYIAQQQKQIEYDKLIERHEQLLQMTTTKMNLANESHEFVERYYKKLENDLNKFKMELEADYSGLTEILENRFASQGCNEYDDKTGETSIFDLSLLDMEHLFDSFDDLTKPKSIAGDYTNQLSLNYLPSPTRRLPAGLTSCNSSFNRKSHQRLHSNPLTSSRGRKRLQSASSTNNIGKRKRNIVPNSFLTDSHYFHQSDDDDESSTNRYFSLKNSTFDDEENHEDFDSSNVLSSLNEQTTGTMDEQRYCFCNQISYGDMIACDNPTCRREWFHYSCVGIITPPKGKWFCNECS